MLIGQRALARRAGFFLAGFMVLLGPALLPADQGLNGTLLADEGQDPPWWIATMRAQIPDITAQLEQVSGVDGVDVYYKSQHKGPLQSSRKVRGPHSASLVRAFKEVALRCGDGELCRCESEVWPLTLYFMKGDESTMEVSFHWWSHRFYARIGSRTYECTFDPNAASSQALYKMMVRLLPGYLRSNANQKPHEGSVAERP